MNFGYIDHSLKSVFLNRKPKIYQFDTGNKLYIFTPFKKPKKNIKKQNIIMINDFSESFYEKFVYQKAILQTLKEKNIGEISFCFENAKDYIFLLEEMFKNNISFSLTDCAFSDEVADYFLENYGHPVRILGRLKTGLLVYIGGTLPLCDDNVLKLDFTRNLPGEKIVISEFLIKNTFFPVKISSFGLLDAALKITGKEIDDLIIKLCIIRGQAE